MGGWNAQQDKGRLKRVSDGLCAAGRVRVSAGCVFQTALSQFLLLGNQLFADEGGGLLALACGNGGEEMEFDGAARLADHHADGLPEADVAVVGGVGVGAAAVGIGVAAKDGNKGNLRFGGGGEEAGFEGEDGAAFAAGAFGEEGDGVAVFEGLGDVADFFAVAAGAFVAGDIDGARLCGKVADNRPFGDVVFGDEAAGVGGVDGHDVEPGDVVADEHLAAVFGGERAVGVQGHAAGGEDAVRPDLDGTQFAAGGVEGEDEEHFGGAVDKAQADAGKAEGKAEGGHGCVVFFVRADGLRPSESGIQTAFYHFKVWGRIFAGSGRSVARCPS